LIHIAAAVIVAQTSGDPLLDWLSRAGALGVLAAIVIAFLRGWVVTGAEAERLRGDRDRALDLVYKQAELAQRALDTAERNQSNV
jgi:O-antigen ligase